MDEIWDDRAHVCTDCLLYHANGTLPDETGHMTSAEAEVFLNTIGLRLEGSGFRLTLGWVREQHDCKSNYTVAPAYRRTNFISSRHEDRREFYSEGGFTGVASLAEMSFPNAVGLNIVSHDLKTEADRGGECDCETETFARHQCVSCGTEYAGEWHAATVWKADDSEW